ncbi:hypothetical protein [Natroniella sp. ANB-PHB2]|uniref:hypothetical protein n=1 Tax=Natroniella sp. ANB-PHB2 TaxID=3384444 RepID=UPI0038D4E4AC
MAKKGDQKDVTINGNDYKLQHPGMTWVFKTQDECKNRFGVMMEHDLIKAYLSDVVVVPNKKNMDDFEGGELQELIKECRSFLGGKLL